MGRKTLVAIVLSAIVGYGAGTVTGYYTGYEGGRNNPKTVWELTHKVIRVIDGDTIVLDNGERVRLAGIDTPELQKKEYYSKEAAEEARLMLEGRYIRISREGNKERDNFGRYLAWVHLDGDEGDSVNYHLVRNGFARVYPRWRNEELRPKFAEAERLAREEGIGIWDLER